MGTFNLDGYLDQPTGRRKAKTEESREKVRETILRMAPDVLAVQELGSAIALEELRTGLKAAGLDLSHYEFVPGYDTNVHLGILSRFPFEARRSHTNDSFLLKGRRFRVSRGFGEVVVKVTPEYRFTLITAHLKSRREVLQADQQDLRMAEARLLREKIDRCLSSDPGSNLVILGDLNDTQDQESTRWIIGGGKPRLLDVRPVESSEVGAGNSDPRVETWTHFYAKEDTFSRIDYILLSPGMSRELLKAHIVEVPGWGLASDHRALVATFSDEEK